MLEGQSVFIATPTLDGRLILQWVSGALQMQARYPGRLRFDCLKSSFIPKSRDILTQRFMDSGATHLLFIDADIGWTPDDADALLDAGVDVVGGCYCKKQVDCGPTWRLLPGQGDLRIAKGWMLPAGFMLISRACIDQMLEAYGAQPYSSGGVRYPGLWTGPIATTGNYDGEDLSFCHRWRALGGDCWVHRDVVLQHIGDSVYLPSAERAEAEEVSEPPRNPAEMILQAKGIARTLKHEVAA